MFLRQNLAKKTRAGLLKETAKKSPNQETGLGKAEGSERYQIGPK